MCRRNTIPQYNFLMTPEAVLVDRHTILSDEQIQSAVRRYKEAKSKSNTLNSSRQHEPMLIITRTKPVLLYLP